MADLSEPQMSAAGDAATVGRWIRHYRKAARLTLEDLGQRVGHAPSHLSLIETGRREPRLSLVQAIAAALGVSIGALTGETPPSHRDALELALERAQQTARYAESGLPMVRPGKAVPTEVLEALVGLHNELALRTSAASATPEEARRANAELRAGMRARQNYFGEIEAEAELLLAAVEHRGGPVGERRIIQIAEHLGFTLHHVNDLPHSTRAVTDTRNQRIYLPTSGWGGHDPRTIVLQTLGHHVLQHQPPRDYADFLRQRVEVNYFAAATLIGESQAVELLQRGKAGRYLAIEDLRDAFAVSYETAAHRFTNLATQHMGIGVHFAKVHESGTIYKAYENNGFPFPTDPIGAIEGQLGCRKWPSRLAFSSVEPGTTHWQYVDTPSGTYWSSVQTEQTPVGMFAVAIGVAFDDSKWFRGRETTLRTRSTCPDPSCCRRAPRELEERWAQHSWPSARAHAHLLATLPPGTFPGVDETSVYEFLEQHVTT